MDETPEFVRQPTNKLEEFQVKLIEIFRRYMDEILGEEFTPEMKDYLENFPQELLDREEELQVVAENLGSFLGEDFLFKNPITEDIDMELSELFLQEIIAHTFKSGITEARIRAILIELCREDILEHARKDLLEHLASHFIASGEETPEALKFIESQLTDGASRFKPKGGEKLGFGDFAVTYDNNLSKFDIKAINNAVTEGANMVKEFMESGININEAIELVLGLKDGKLPFKVNP